MVRTRQRSFSEDHLSQNYIELDSCRKTRSRRMLHVCDDDLDSDESAGSGFIPRKRRRIVEMTSRRSQRISARQRLAEANAMAGPSYLTRRTMRAIKEEQVLEEGEEEEEVDDDDNDNNEDSIFDDGQGTDDEEAEQDNNRPILDNRIETPPSHKMVNGIRRSTRQRKSLYGTLNQSWILGSKTRDFPNLEGLPDGDKGERKRSRDETDPEYDDDMYTRVKNQRRRKSIGSYYSLNKEKDGLQGMQGTEEETGDDCESDEDDHSVVIQERCRAGGGRWDSSKSSGEESHLNGVNHPKYYLRQKKPIINRFQMPIETNRQKKTVNKNVFHVSPPHRISKFHVFKSPAHKSPVVQRRHATHNSSGSSSSSATSSSEDERRFERRKTKSMAKARKRCLPMNLSTKDLQQSVMSDRIKTGSSLADVDPMNIDRAVTFDSIGGLTKHLESLKEMILFPLLYPEVFEKFKISPPRGVLFYGPPGTGKTLVARALANECSQGDRRVAFFMRKGADCLSKWVGESERQLRLLFDQAFCMRPSIIFFDEIDGLAPVRSSRQDQIHSSIVSTLLALMDGLDSRGEVVVIGATNRIDAIDPALRRPGRFDREFHFPLPSLEGRHSILKIHTKEWVPKLDNGFMNEIALKTTGYCGADLKALCAEVALLALKRRYPQIYNSRQKLQLDISSIKVNAKDFLNAMEHLVPAAQRSVSSPGHSLSPVIQPLLQNILDKVVQLLDSIFPHKAKMTKTCHKSSASTDSCSEEESDDERVNIYEGPTEEMHHVQHPKLPNGVVANKSLLLLQRSCSKKANSHRPRLLLAGDVEQGQTTHLAPAVLHSLERFPVHRLDLPTLYAVTAKAPEESCAQVFSEARRTLPCILYLPHVGQWWDTLGDTVRATFLTLLADVEPSAPILLFATSDCPFSDLPEQIQNLFSRQHGEVVTLKNPTKVEREAFFSDLILHQPTVPPRLKRKTGELPEQLPVAPVRQTRVLNEVELKRLEAQEESTFRELRLFLREILYKLARDRRFTHFTKPVDVSEVSDYLDVVKVPMDLETMLTKIDTHQYQTVSQFLEDIDLICHNALEYNPDKHPCDKIIRHRACALRDAAHAIVDSELDPEFEKICRDIVEARRRRGCLPNKYAPKNYNTLPRNIIRGHVNSSSEVVSTVTGIPSSSVVIENPMTAASTSDHLIANKRPSRSLRGNEALSSSSTASRGRMAESHKSSDTDSGESRLKHVKSKRLSSSSQKGTMARRRNALGGSGGNGRRRGVGASVKLSHGHSQHVVPKFEFVMRRRRSLWFGASRRRIVRRRVVDASVTSSKTSAPANLKDARMTAGADDGSIIGKESMNVSSGTHDDDNDEQEEEDEKTIMMSTKRGVEDEDSGLVRQLFPPTILSHAVDAVDDVDLTNVDMFEDADEHLTSDLSKDSGTGNCQHGSPTLSESNGGNSGSGGHGTAEGLGGRCGIVTRSANDSLEQIGDGIHCCILKCETKCDYSTKEVSSGFSSEDGTNQEAQGSCERLEAGGACSQKTDRKQASSSSAQPSKENSELNTLPPRKVVIDTNQLKWLLDSIVRCTEDCSVESLERFHCSLQRCVVRHRRHWDKTALLKDLENQLDTFKRQHRAS